MAAVRAIYFNGGYYSSYMSHSAGLGSTGIFIISIVNVKRIT